MRIIRRLMTGVRCFLADYRVFPRMDSWSVYPRSFYMRYTAEEQQKIMEKDRKRIRELLESCS